ncbi:hypothetical protein [Microbacterium xylanilyticum]
MNTFRIRVRCTDCSGVDQQGCFGGGVSWVQTALVSGDFSYDGQQYSVGDVDMNPADAAAFEDRALAEAVASVGDRAELAGPWALEVVAIA